MLTWWWPALIAVASGTILMVLGVAAWFVAPPRADAKRVGLLVLLQGIGMAFGFGWFNLADTPQAAAAFRGVAWIGFTTLLPIELLFLSTLRTRWAAWLRPRPLQWILWALVPVGMILPIVAREAYGTTWAPAADHRWVVTPTALGTLIPLLHGVFAVLGLILAIRQRKEAGTDPVRRRQANAYLGAFIIRDVNWAIMLLILVPLGVALETPSASLIIEHALFELAFVMALTYGALSAHLFDIDVKARIAVNGSTVAAALAFVFFLTSEIVEATLPVESGTGSIIAAAAVAVLLLPVRRLADLVARRAFPRADVGLDARRAEIYLSAFLAAARDGRVTDKERDVLRDLQASLGLSSAQANALEAPPTP